MKAKTLFILIMAVIAFLGIFNMILQLGIFDKKEVETTEDLQLEWQKPEYEYGMNLFVFSNPDENNIFQSFDFIQFVYNGEIIGRIIFNNESIQKHDGVFKFKKTIGLLEFQGDMQKSLEVMRNIYKIDDSLSLVKWTLRKKEGIK